MHEDIFIAIISLLSPFYLFIHLAVSAHSKEWWGLHEKLIQKRGWYARRHRELINSPLEKMNDLKMREALTNLEREFNNNENRFGEVKEIIGVQSEDIYPSIVGFKRPLFSTFLKVIFPVPFAAILVFVDNNELAIVSVLVLFLSYFVL